MSSEHDPSQHPGYRGHPWGLTLGKRASLVGGTAVLVAVAAISAVIGHSTAPGRPQGNDVAFPIKSLLGMSAPAGTWNQRVSEVGPGLEARRIFVSSFSGSLNLATTACNAGMTPIISFKEGSYSPAQIAAGNADAALRSLNARLVALPCSVFATIHHEPSSDMTAAEYTKMLARALPILGGSLTDLEVRVGPIANGWFWNTNNQGLSDSEMDQWVGPSVRAVSDFVAGDVYQGKATAEGSAGKIKNMGSWARRVNTKTPTTPVRGLGLGEFNVQTAPAITDALAALGSDPLFMFGCLWNANGSGAANATVLTGDKLAAFKTGLANW